MSERYEKQAAGEIVVQNRFVKWLDNFWYHYKWHTIVIAFFLFVGVVCFVQCSTSQGSAAIRLAYVGGYEPTAEERQNILNVFESVSPEEEGTGVGMAVDLRTFGVYSEEQIKKLCWDEEAGQVHTPSANSLQQLSHSNFEQFYSYSQTGDSAVWLVSENVYRENLDRSRIRPLSDLYQTAPESAYDEYAIRLSETALYNYYDALKALPEDTLIVLPRQLVLGSSSDDGTYATFVAMFRAIVEFQAPAVQ